jgi:hypothetical protein
VKKNYWFKVLLKKLEIWNMSKRVKTRAQRDKDRRQSRGPAEIRRYHDIWNTARRIASQRSQSSEQDIPMYHPDPAPNISCYWD